MKRNRPWKTERSTLPFRLARLTWNWRRLLNAQFQYEGLTESTWRPLLYLHTCGDGIRQKVLALSLGMDRPTLVRILDALVEKGLVLREQDDGDRRAKLLYLTPQGREVVAGILDTVTVMEKELLGHFSDREFSNLDKFLASLETTVEEVQARPRPHLQRR